MGLTGDMNDIMNAHNLADGSFDRQNASTNVITMDEHLEG